MGGGVALLEVGEIETETPPELEVLFEASFELFVRGSRGKLGVLAERLDVGDGLGYLGLGFGFRGGHRREAGRAAENRIGSHDHGGGRGRQVDGGEDLPDRANARRVGRGQWTGGFPDDLEEAPRKAALRARRHVLRKLRAAGRAVHFDQTFLPPFPRDPERRRSGRGCGKNSPGSYGPAPFRRHTMY